MIKDVFEANAPQDDFSEWPRALAGIHAHVKSTTHCITVRTDDMETDLRFFLSVRRRSDDMRNRSSILRICEEEGLKCYPTNVVS